jgi:hypothetical protein
VSPAVEAETVEMNAAIAARGVLDSAEPPLNANLLLIMSDYHPSQRSTVPRKTKVMLCGRMGVTFLASLWAIRLKMQNARPETPEAIWTGPPPA